MNSMFLACGVCAANSANDTTNAGGYSILFMLGVILGMLGVVSFFMIRMIRRSDHQLDPELRDEPAAPLPSR
jgi:ABC-type sulfate transport system permease component